MRRQQYLLRPNSSRASLWWIERVRLRLCSRVHCVQTKAISPFREVCLQQTEIGFPFISNNLSASEASHRDNHRFVKMFPLTLLKRRNATCLLLCWWDPRIFLIVRFLRALNLRSVFHKNQQKQLSNLHNNTYSVKFLLQLQHSNMAQGNHKLGKAKKSGGSQRKRGGKAVKHKRKGSSNIENNKSTIETSKAICKKNERLVAAKALGGGTNFFLKDIAERG